MPGRANETRAPEPRLQTRPSRFLVRAVDEPNRNLPARRQDDQPIELEFEVVDGPGVEASSDDLRSGATGGPFGSVPGPDAIADALKIHRRQTLFRWLRHTVIIGGLLLILIQQGISWAKTALVFYALLAAVSLIGRFKLISLNSRLLSGLSGMTKGPGGAGRL